MSKAANRKDQKYHRSLFLFPFSAPALLAVRGSPLTARSFARRSFDRSKNTRKRKRLLAVYKNTGHVVKTTTKRYQKIIMLTSLIVGTTFTILVLRQNDKGQEYSKHCQQKIIKQQQFKIHQTETSEMPGTQLAVEIMYMSYHSIYLQYIKAKINVSQSSKSFFPVYPRDTLRLRYKCNTSLFPLLNVFESNGNLGDSGDTTYSTITIN